MRVQENGSTKKWKNLHHFLGGMHYNKLKSVIMRECLYELFPLSDGAVLTSPGHVGDVGVCPCDLWPLPCSSLQSGWHRWEPIDMLSLTSVSFLSLIGTVYSHQLKFVRKCNTVLKAHFTLGTCPMRCYFTLQSKRTGVKETRQWCQVVTLFWSAFQV